MLIVMHSEHDLCNKTYKKEMKRVYICINGEEF